MKICEYCGASIDEYKDRCPNCGAPVAEEEETAAETAEPQPIQPTPPPAPEIPAETVQSVDENAVKRKSVKFALLFAACFILFCIAVRSSPHDGPSYDSDAAFERNVQYLNAFDKAVNSRNFSDIGDFVDEDSPAYKYIKNLVASRRSTVSYQSWRYLWRSSSYNESYGLIAIETHEKYFFRYRAGGEGYKDIFMTYYVEPNSPYRIKKAEQRKDPYTMAWRLGKVTGGSVNIRGHAGTDNDHIIAQAMRGDLVKIYPNETKTENGTTWLWIRHDKIGLGWISAKYVDDEICTQ